MDSGLRVGFLSVQVTQHLEARQITERGVNQIRGNRDTCMDREKD